MGTASSLAAAHTPRLPYSQVAATLRAKASRSVDDASSPGRVGQDNPSASLVDNESLILARAGGDVVERPGDLASLVSLVSGEGSHPRLLLAASGAGKSTLVALFAVHAKTLFTDALIVSAFVGSVEGSKNLARVLHAVCARLAPSCMDTEVAESGGVATGVRALTVALGGMLTHLSEIGKRVFLVVDAVNELEGAAASTFAWLPSPCPPLVTLLLTTIDGNNASRHDAACVDGIRRRWSGVAEMRLATLSSEDLSAMAKSSLSSRARVLPDTVLHAILELPGATSPLFLRLVGDAVRHNPAETTTEFIASLPPDIPSCFDRAVLELEAAHPVAAKSVLVAVFCCRGGACLAWLHQMVLLMTTCDTDNGGAMVATPAGWASFTAAAARTILNFQPGGAVNFTHMQARNAVGRAYLGSHALLHAAHLRLCGYFAALSDPRADGSFEGPNGTKQVIRQVILHARKCGDAAMAGTLFGNLVFCEKALAAGLSGDLLSALAGIESDDDQLLREVRRHALLLNQFPWTLANLACNSPDTSILQAAGERQVANATAGSGRRPMLLHINKPQYKQPLRQSFGGARDLIWCSSFSCDGQHIAVGGADYMARIYSLATADQVGLPLPHSDELYHVEFSPVDPNILVSVSSFRPRREHNEQDVAFWDIAKARRTCSLSPAGNVSSAAWSRDGTRVALASSAPEISIWLFADGSCKLLSLLQLQCDDGGVGGATFDETGSHVAAALGNNVAIYRLPKGDGPSSAGIVCKGHIEAVCSVAWSSQWIASSSQDQSARLWMAQTGACVAVFSHKARVTSVALYPQGASIWLLTSDDKSVRLWSVDLVADQESSPTGGASTTHCKGVLSEHSADVQCVAFAPNKGNEGTELTAALSCCDDGILRLWSLEDLTQCSNEKLKLDHSPHAVSSSVFLGPRIVSADAGGKVFCSEPCLNRLVWSTRLVSQDPSCAAVSSLAPLYVGSRGFVVAGMCKVVHVLEALTGAVVLSLTFRDWVNACCSTPANAGVGGSVFACAGDRGCASAWHARLDSSGGGEAQLVCDRLEDYSGSNDEGHDYFACALDDRGRSIAYGGNNCAVVLNRLDATAGGSPATPVSFACESWVVSLAFCPEGAHTTTAMLPLLLAATTKAGIIHLWSILEGSECPTQVLQHAMGREPTMTAWCAFFCDKEDQKTWLVTANSHKLVQLWEVFQNGEQEGSMGAVDYDPEAEQEEEPAALSVRLHLAAVFPASGKFGSADGIGGEGSLDRETGTLVIGDQSGQLYLLRIRS